MASLHKPEWRESNNDAAFSTYTYNADDTVATMTDPRGAVTTNTYGNPGFGEKRAVVVGVAYTSPGSSIPDPADVAFTYDYAGNRLSMSDGTGTLNYTYDELSRIVTETKDFDDYLESAPSGVYTLTYNYHLTGGIKSITDPFGGVMSYAVDKVGRGTSVGNNSSSTAYASGMTHRAFGGVKAMSISTADPIEIAMGYDSALRPISYEADSAANTIEIQKADYTYLPDGLLKEVDNHADHNFDQVSEYDFAGRLKMNDVGEGNSTHPFKQTLGYDAFSNLLTRTNWTYSFDARTFTATYANNRKATGGSLDSYDVAGNVIYSHTYSHLDNIWSTFDVAGRKSRWEEYGPYGDNQYKGEEITYDGDGRPAKRAELTKDRIGGVWGDWNENNKYFIYSSVTGKGVTDLNETGQLYKTHVYVGDAMIADRFVDDSLLFQVTDPLTGSTRQVGDDGAIFSGDEEETRNEQAGLGTTVPNVAPSNFPSPNYGNGGYVGSPESGCEYEGSPMPCSIAAMWSNWDEERKNKPVKKDKPGKEKRPVLKPRVQSREIEFPDSYIFADNVKQTRRGLMKLKGDPDSLGLDNEAVSDFQWVTAPVSTGFVIKPSMSRITSEVDFCLNSLWPSASHRLSIKFNEVANSGIQNGIMTLTSNSTLDRESAGKRFSSTSYSIVTDAMSSSGKQLGDRYTEANPDSPIRGGFLPAYTPFDPNTSGTGVNYLANDLRSHTASTFTGLDGLIGLDLALQIHEAGNSISAQLGGLPESPTYGKEDSDSGMVVEECLYGRLTARR